jgi:hypothetical protein
MVWNMVLTWCCKPSSMALLKRSKNITPNSTFLWATYKHLNTILFVVVMFLVYLTSICPLLAFQFLSIYVKLSLCVSFCIQVQILFLLLLAFVWRNDMRNVLLFIDNKHPTKSVTLSFLPWNANMVLTMSMGLWMGHHHNRNPKKTWTLDIIKFMFWNNLKCD